MSVLVVGGAGNMGARYRAILRHLDIPHSSVDKETPVHSLRDLASNSSGVIVATPTDTHNDILEEIYTCGKPILCEKPLSKDVVRLGKILVEMKKERSNLTMIYQYSMMTQQRNRMGFYDYFKHGIDGIAWDCTQIIALTNGNCTLREQSPVWRCWIGDDNLSISKMDLAYIDFIKSWLSKPGQDLNWLFDVHVEVNRIQGEYERPLSSHDRHSGQDH